MTRRLAGALLLVLALGACRVDTTLAVRVRSDGGGTVEARVRLDREALAALLVDGGTLEERIRIDDLRAAGWTARWRVAKSSPPAFAELELEKPFTAPAQVRGIVEELNGPAGPVPSVGVRRDVGSLRTSYRFLGIADLSRLDAGVAADPEVAASLSGQRVDVSGLDRALTARVREALRLTVRAELPGAGARTWVVPAGSRKVLASSSSTFDATHVVWLAFGGALALAAILLFVVGERRARRRRRDAGA